jgi:hypothetical protein
MSIALDLALLLRNSCSKFGLSVANMGVLYTLAFRVGTKSNSWISQKTLANELGIDERNLRTRLCAIAQTKIIFIKQSARDKRKDVYSFNPVFLNYHQMKTEEREKVHSKLGDAQKNTGRKHPAHAQNTGRDHPLYTGRDHPVVSDAQMLEALEPRGLQENAQIAKGTYENNIKDKATDISCAKGIAHAQSIEDSFNQFWFAFPKKKDKERAKKIWIKNKLHEIKDMIISDVIERRKKDQQWQTTQFIPHASTYLNNKLWNDEIYCPQPVQIVKKEIHNKNEPRSTVQWFSDNH